MANSEWLYKYAKRICYANYDDLCQHLLLILLEMPESKLIHVHNEGYLQIFCYKIMKNQTNGKSQKFHKQIKLQSDIDVFELEESMSELKKYLVEEIDERDFEEESEIYDNKVETVQRVLNANKWYERKIFELWSEGNSARKISRDTGISVREILRVIKFMKEQMINQL